MATKGEIEVAGQSIGKVLGLFFDETDNKEQTQEIFSGLFSSGMSGYQMFAGVSADQRKAVAAHLGHAIAGAMLDELLPLEEEPT